MYCGFLKNILDKILALILFVLFLPFLVGVAVLIYLTMGSPILFKQVRPGKDEILFTIYKFRTMSDEKDDNGDLLEDHKRLKGVGKLIRSFSLDELPQLFNVLKGDMSFIGPRPLLVEYLPLYNDIQKKRHNVKPGITGWAQVNGRNAISWKKKFDLDVWYVENISFITDLKILFMTFGKIFRQKDISSQTHVTMEKFDGTN